MMKEAGASKLQSMNDDLDIDLAEEGGDASMATLKGKSNTKKQIGGKDLSAILGQSMASEVSERQGRGEKKKQVIKAFPSSKLA